MYILRRHTNIDGHDTMAYYAENMNGKGSFILFGDNVAKRFNTPMDAWQMLEYYVKEKGYLKENMHIIETDQQSTGVLVL